jgi:hypothetical protein
VLSLSVLGHENTKEIQYNLIADLGKIHGLNSVFKNFTTSISFLTKNSIQNTINIHKTNVNFVMISHAISYEDYIFKNKNFNLGFMIVASNSIHRASLIDFFGNEKTMTLISEKDLSFGIRTSIKYNKTRSASLELTSSGELFNFGLGF